MYIVVDPAQLLNTDMQTISDWDAAWLVTLNPLNTVNDNLAQAQSYMPPSPLYEWYNDQEHRFLTFSYSGTSDNHVKSISEKSWSMNAKLVQSCQI